MFDANVCEAIGIYVYALKNPNKKDEIFYIGKGENNRCFEHIKEAVSSSKESLKLEIIRDIQNSRKEVKIDIIRHSLNAKTALEIEASLIDVLELTEKGNLVLGHGVERGLKRAQEIQIQFGAKELETKTPLLLVKINEQYDPKKNMTFEEIYRISRWAWRLDIQRAEKVRHVLAVANGIVRGVFTPTGFFHVNESDPRYEEVKGKVYFEGKIETNSEFLYKSTAVFGERGAQSPVRYINC